MPSALLARALWMTYLLQAGLTMGSTGSLAVNDR